MKGHGTKYERETVIGYNEESDDAHVWTASETVYNRMKRRGWEPVEDGERHAVFTVPKKAILTPRKRKVIPEAQREALRASATSNLRGARAKKAIPERPEGAI